MSNSSSPKEQQEITLTIGELAEAMEHIRRNSSKFKTSGAQIAIKADRHTIAAINEVTALRGSQAKDLAKQKIITALAKRHQKRGRLRQYVNTSALLRNQISAEVFDDLLEELEEQGQIVTVGANVYKC